MRTHFDELSKAVCSPQGELSFADLAVSYTPGTKTARKEIHRDPAQALGVPDYTKPSAPGIIALGCDGSIVLQFTDNVVTNVEGTDLYIFEVGPDVEAAEVAVSSDGKNWISVGSIEGARSEIDIEPYVEADSVFTYVKITNASKDCSGSTPGADIDAVAAVGSGLRMSLSSEVLFDVAKSDLKDPARAELDKIAEKISTLDTGYRMVVEGHTDSDGSTASNQPLSVDRAQSVWDYLKSKSTDTGTSDAKVVGYGESRPVGENETEEGKAQNRRVNILVLPATQG